MKHIYRMTITALFSAIGIILVSLLPVTPFAGASFLVYDLAEVPILLSTLFFGPISGLTSLLIVCLFQAFLLGKDTFVGFFMHFIASGTMLLVLSGVYYCAKKFTDKLSISFTPALLIRLIAGLIFATVAMTAVMLILNYIITPIYQGVPRDVVAKMIPTILLPFNLLKGALNSVMTLALFAPLHHFLIKNSYANEIVWSASKKASPKDTKLV